MSNIQIPNLPAVIGLIGTELFEGVQAGSSVKITLDQIIAASAVGTPTSLPLSVAVGGTGATNEIDARTNLGLGSIAVQSASSVSVTGGTITGITDLAVADGGTGASTLTGYVKGTGTAALTASATIPSSDIAGLGTMSTQNANGVAITGGSITGITDLAVVDGGTGLSTYAIGDILYASGVSTFSKLSDVATGNVIISGGVGVAPSYGKVGLATHVSGILPVANGGTNISSYGIGDILYASASGVLSRLSDVATGNALISGGVGVAPSYGKIGLSTHVSGTLPLANGGTGATSAAAAVTSLGGTVTGSAVFTAVTAAAARTALGTVIQTSATDTTAGSLLSVGAFGVGVTGTAPVLAAIDATTTASGTYSYTTGATGTFPANVTAAAGGVINVYRESSTKGYMTLQPAGSIAVYLRNLSTTWGSWQSASSSPILTKTVVSWKPIPSDNASSRISMANLNETGNGTSFPIAVTNRFTYQPRYEYLVTAAALTAVAGFRGVEKLATIGGPAGLGGFSFTGRWGPATGVSTATNRAFFGLSSISSAPTDVEPSTLLNSVFMGWDAADANIQIMHNDGAGTCTKIDLGASFPVPTVDRTSVYELELSSPAGVTQSVNYLVRDLNSGATSSGTISSNMPSVSTILGFYGYVSSGGTLSVIGMALFSLYLDLLL